MWYAFLTRVIEGYQDKMAVKTARWAAWEFLRNGASLLTHLRNVVAHTARGVDDVSQGSHSTALLNTDRKVGQKMSYDGKKVDFWTKKGITGQFFVFVIRLHCQFVNWVQVFQKAEREGKGGLGRRGKNQQ